jgi:hypothetical protein
MRLLFRSITFNAKMVEARLFFIAAAPAAFNVVNMGMLPRLNFLNRATHDFVVFDHGLTVNDITNGELMPERYVIKYCYRRQTTVYRETDRLPRHDILYGGATLSASFCDKRFTHCHCYRLFFNPTRSAAKLHRRPDTVNTKIVMSENLGFRQATRRHRNQFGKNPLPDLLHRLLTGNNRTGI